jgi:glycerate 2-kinase
MTLDSDARRIAAAGVRAVRAGPAVRHALRRRGRTVSVGARSLPVAPGGTVHVVALGKAAGEMADAARSVLGPTTPGVVATPRGYPAPRSGLRVVFGEHPVPGPGSVRAGTALLAYAAATAPGDAVVFLLSGGGSAVAELPAPGLSIGDLARTTELLLASGAPIGAMNAVRRHLSRLKGGQLAGAVRADRFATIAISDVIGDAPEDIASGPTVPDPSTFADALAAGRTYGLAHRLPAPVARRLRAGAAGAIPETPKPGDRRWRGAPYVLAARNRTAVDGAARAARRLGYATRVLRAPVLGETRSAADRFARALLRDARSRSAARVGLVGGGETTVTLGRHPGKGGRNQEFALVAAPRLAGRAAVVLSLGTDGIDGPTDAAGGWTDGRSLRRARAIGLDLERAIRTHAAYPALRALGSLWITGPTGTNVTDLHVGLAVRRADPGTARSSPRRAAPSSRRRRS